MKAGWYWVKWFKGKAWQVDSRWEVAELTKFERWYGSGHEEPSSIPPPIIGPRIEPPGPDWKPE